MNSVRALFGGVIDYAGLFPPASLSMEAAVENYAAYRAGEHGWALDRFILPLARVPEFESAAGDRAANWRLSLLVPPGTTTIPLGADTVEIKVQNPADIRNIGPDVTAYYEISIDDDPAELIAIMAGVSVRAKIRTGGSTPDAAPSPANLARFLARCAARKVPFKATAGLHHAMRNPAGRSGAMHGFLNVFLAAALIWTGAPEDDVIQALEETSPDAFRFEGAAVTWRERRVTAEQLVEVRRSFAIGFGSCSFEEPLADLKALGLL